MDQKELQTTAVKLNIACSYDDMKRLIHACNTPSKEGAARLEIEGLFARNQVIYRRGLFVALVTIFLLVAMRMIERSNHTSGHILPSLMMYFIPMITVAVYGKRLALVTKCGSQSVRNYVICIMGNAVAFLLTTYLWTGHVGMLITKWFYQGEDYIRFWNTFLFILCMFSFCIMLIALYYLFMKGTFYYMLYCNWYLVFCYSLNYRVLHSRVNSMELYNEFLTWNYRGYLIAVGFVLLGSLLCAYFVQQCDKR